MSPKQTPPFAPPFGSVLSEAIAVEVTRCKMTFTDLGAVVALLNGIFTVYDRLRIGRPLTALSMEHPSGYRGRAAPSKPACRAARLCICCAVG